MNITKYKHKRVACFQKDELKKFFETAKIIEILNEQKKQGIYSEELRNNHEKMENLVSVVSDKTSNDRDDHEVFAAIFVFHDFYEKDSEICFLLKDQFNPR